MYHDLLLGARRRRRSGVGKVVGQLAVQTLLGAILIDWVIMIQLGVIHAQILPAVLPAGFWSLLMPSLGLAAVYQITSFIKGLFS